MAGNITYIGNGRFRLRASVGSGVERKVFSKNIKYDGKIDEEKIKEGKYPESVKKELAKYVTDIDGGQVVIQNNVTFKEFVDIWKRDYASKLAAKTQARYDSLFDRIFPAIGHIKIQKINPTVLNKFYNNLGEVGMKLPKIKNKVKQEEILKKQIKENPDSTKLSNTTIHRHHELISSVLSKAVQWGYIVSNPAERADPPKVEDVDHTYLQDGQVTIVLEALSKEPLKYQAAIMLDIFSGLRRGELLGLNWSDIDWDKRTVKVERESQYINGIGIFQKDGLKTKASKRTNEIPVFVIKMLKYYKNMQQIEKNKKRKKGTIVEENDRIFIQRNGKPMHPDTLTQWFPKFLKRNNLDHVNFHGLRHTFASLVSSMGFDPVTGATLMGHANKATYLKLYAHMFESTKSLVADKMEEQFAPKNEAKTELK